jgi:arylsulfatase A-like enzyme/Flp pilus assembly protein TadD
LSRPVRYTVILALVGLGTLLAAVGGWRYARASAPVNGPIVLVSIDALRADRVSAYGGRTKTPNIDALAADGIVFERAYAQVPQTLPSHASLLTGRLPHENGVRDGAGFTLKPSERTLAEMLEDRGYATGGIVSSFLLRADTGIGQGFAFFDADLESPEDHSHPLARPGADAEKVAERWLDSLGTSRALLFLHLADLLPGQSADDAPATYEQRITAADDVVGRLMQYLKAHQLYDRSTIILLADHGEGLGEHGETRHGLLAYEETLRVPLIIKQPGGEQKGRRVRDVVRLVDVAPTVLDLTKAPIPGNLHGRSLTPLLSGGTLSPAHAYSETLFGKYHFGWSDLVSVTDGKYRYISAPREELYDLETDPAERQNLASAQPKIVAALKAALKDLSEQGPAPKAEPVSESDREKLEALGYVGTFMPSLPSADPADPKDGVEIVERFRAAVARADAGELADAIDQFRALSALAPGNADIWRHLANVAAKAERSDVALDAWKQAADLLPADAATQIGAANAALRARKIEDARRFARVVLDIPRVEALDQGAAHEVLARAALTVRNLEEARTEAALAEELAPGRPVSAYITGRIAFDRRRYAEALESFEPALTVLDKTPDAKLADLRLLTAEALSATGRYSEAEYLFMRELEDNPQSVRARSGLTSVYKSTGRTDEAEALTH